MANYRICLFAVALVLPARAENRVDVFGDPLPPRALARFGTSAHRHESKIVASRFSPDGKSFYTASKNSVRVWDTKTGKQLRKTAFHSKFDNSFVRAAFSSDAKLLAVGLDGCLALHEVDSGKEVRRLELPKRFFTSLAFSHNNSYLAAAETGRFSVLLWDLNTAKHFEVKHPYHDISGLTFSPKNKVLAALAGNPDELILWDHPTKPNPVRRSLTKRGKDTIEIDPSEFCFSPDGKTLIAAAQDDLVHRWDVRTGKMLEGPKNLEQLRSDRHSTITAVRSTAKGDKLLLLHHPRRVVLRDVKSNKVLRDLIVDWFDGSAFSPNGRYFASWLKNVICMVDLVTAKDHWPIGPHEPITYVALDREGTKLAIASKSHSLILGNVEKPQSAKRVRGAYPSQLVSLRDGKTLVALNHVLGKAIFYDNTTGKVLAALDRHATAAGKILSLDYDPNRNVLALGGVSATVLVDPRMRKVIRTLATNNGHLRSIRFASDGKRIMVRQDEIATRYKGLPEGFPFIPKHYSSSMIQFWDVRSGDPLGQSRKDYQFYPHSSLSISMDGKSLVAQNEKGTWELLELRTLQVRSGLRGSTLACYSPNGRVLACGKADGSIQLCHPLTLETFGTLEGHNATITTLSFSEDGTRLASGSADTTVLVWNLQGLSLRSKPKKKLPEKELKPLWNGLASDKADIAFASVVRLVEHPQQSVRWLAKTMKPVHIGEQQIRKWLKELDDDEFPVRERASRNLKLLDKSYLPTLRKTLATTRSAEVAIRLRSIVEVVARHKLPLGVLRDLRAIEVLEQIDTPESTQLLRKLAKGNEGFIATREAKAALRRRTAEEAFGNTANPSPKSAEQQHNIVSEC